MEDMMKKSTAKNFLLRLGIARAVLIAVTLLTIGLAQSARADDTYTFTGMPFYYDGANCYPACVTNVSGSFTVSSPLASNTTYNLEPDTVAGGTITSYDFTDGRNSWDLANFVAADSFGQVSEFSITTGNGNIVAWDINIDDYAGPTFGYYCPSCTQGVITTAWNGSTGSNATNVWNNYDAYSYDPSEVNQLGTWTGTVTTPEPSTSSLLFGAGLLCLLGLAVEGKRLAPTASC